MKLEVTIEGWKITWFKICTKDYSEKQRKRISHNQEIDFTVQRNLSLVEKYSKYSL